MSEKITTKKDEKIKSLAERDNNDMPCKNISKEILSLFEIQAGMASPTKLAIADEFFIKQIMQGGNPKDPIEAMLLSQMIVTHNLAMSMLFRGGVESEKVLVGEMKGASSAVKLLNVFTRQVEALKNYRGKKSTQKIIVEQVKVESGGQVVVGNIKTQGGACEEG